MEWLWILAVLACPLVMAGMAAIAWVVGKRAGRGFEEVSKAPAGEGGRQQSALTPGA